MNDFTERRYELEIQRILDVEVPAPPRQIRARVVATSDSLWCVFCLIVVAAVAGGLWAHVCR